MDEFVTYREFTGMVERLRLAEWSQQVACGYLSEQGLLALRARLDGREFEPSAALDLLRLDVEADDQVLLRRGLFVYDALYAWCARQVAAPV